MAAASTTSPTFPAPRCRPNPTVDRFLREVKREFRHLTAEDEAFLAGHRDLYDSPLARQLLVHQGILWAYKVAISITNNKELAAEIATDAAMYCAGMVDPAKGRLSTILTWQVRNLARRRMEVAARLKMQMGTEPLDESKVYAGDRGDAEYAARERRRRGLHRLIEKLPDDCVWGRVRKVLLLRAEGLKFHEIGQEMGFCRERARQLETKGIKRLREIAGVGGGGA